MELKKYKHEAPYSYTLGMAPTLELIQYKPDAVDKIYVHPEYTPRDEIYNIFEVCKHACLPCEVNKKIFDRLSMKENVFVIGAFLKYNAPVLSNRPAILFWSTPVTQVIWAPLFELVWDLDSKISSLFVLGWILTIPKPFALLWEPYFISAFPFLILSMITTGSSLIMKFTRLC